jgi:hypothetical protein
MSDFAKGGSDKLTGGDNSGSGVATIDPARLQLT